MIYGLSEIRQTSATDILNKINEFYSSLKRENRIRDVFELTLLIQQFNDNLELDFEKDMQDDNVKTPVQRIFNL